MARSQKITRRKALALFAVLSMMMSVGIAKADSSRTNPFANLGKNSKQVAAVIRQGTTKLDQNEKERESLAKRQVQQSVPDSAVSQRLAQIERENSRIADMSSSGLRRFPTDSYVLSAVADQTLRTDPEKARALADQAVASAGNDRERIADAYNTRALVAEKTGDFPAAAADAKRVLAVDPANKEALARWHANKGRVRVGGPISPADAPSALPPTSASAPAAAPPASASAPAPRGVPAVSADDSSKPYKLAVKSRAKVLDVPALSDESKRGNPPSSSPYWPWPAGWGLAAMGAVWGVKKKLDDGNLIGPVAMTGMGLSLLAFSAMFPPASVVTTPEGVKFILAPAVARVAVGTVGSALTAKGTVEVGQALVSHATGDDTSSRGNPEPKGGEPSKPTVESRIKDADLPTEGDFRFEPPKRYRPGNDLPSTLGKVKGYIDRYGNVWQKGRYHGKPGKFGFEWDVQLSEAGKRVWGQFARGKDYINVRPDGMLSH